MARAVPALVKGTTGTVVLAVALAAIFFGIRWGSRMDKQATLIGEVDSNLANPQQKMASNVRLKGNHTVSKLFDFILENVRREGNHTSMSEGSTVNQGGPIGRIASAVESSIQLSQQEGEAKGSGKWYGALVIVALLCASGIAAYMNNVKDRHSLQNELKLERRECLWFVGGPHLDINGQYLHHGQAGMKSKYVMEAPKDKAGAQDVLCLFYRSKNPEDAILEGWWISTSEQIEILLVNPEDDRGRVYAFSPAKDTVPPPSGWKFFHGAASLKDMKAASIDPTFHVLICQPVNQDAFKGNPMAQTCAECKSKFAGVMIEADSQLNDTESQMLIAKQRVNLPSKQDGSNADSQPSTRDLWYCSDSCCQKAKAEFEAIKMQVNMPG